jgi:Right handed beta helix region
MIRVPVTVAVLASAQLLGGCSSFKNSGDAPAGLQCSQLVSAGSDSSSLTAALSAASPGSCVLLEQATYAGVFAVPAGVTLASPQGIRAVLRGGTPVQPTVSLVGAVGSGLSNLDVQVTGGVGLDIDGGPVLISDVTVSGATAAAAAASCGAPCTSTATIALSDVDLGTSLVGLSASGAFVTWNGGASHDHSAMGQLTGGDGIVASQGATLQLTGVTVTNNGGVGVLVDGTAGTSATLTNVTVSGNAGRGIWAQNLTGSVDAPALMLTQTTVTQNRIVGLGVLASTGVLVTGGSIDSTVSAPVATDVGSVENVGDGVDLFGGTSDVRIDSTSITNNARAAGVIDAAGTGIDVVSTNVQAGGSSLLFVIQRSSNAVDVPAASTSSVQAPLPIASGALPVAQ